MFFFFFNDAATTEIYTLHIVGSVRLYKRQDMNMKCGVDPFLRNTVVAAPPIASILKACDVHQAKRADAGSLCQMHRAMLSRHTHSSMRR